MTMVSMVTCLHKPHTKFMSLSFFLSWTYASLLQAVGAELGHLPDSVYKQLLAAVPAALHPAAAASAAELMDGPQGGAGPLALLAGAQGPLQEDALQDIVQGGCGQEKVTWSMLD